MGIVVAGNDLSHLKFCATDGSHDDKFTRVKGSKLCQEGRKLLTEQFQLINTQEPTLIVIDEADVDSSNPEILTVQEEEDGDKDDDVQIDFPRYHHHHHHIMYFRF